MANNYIQIIRIIIYQRQQITAMTEVLNQQENQQSEILRNASNGINKLPTKVQNKFQEGGSQIIRRLAKTLLDSLQNRNISEEYIAIVQQNSLLECIKDEIVERRYLPANNVKMSCRNMGSQGYLKSNNQVSIKSIKLQNMHSNIFNNSQGKCTNNQNDQNNDTKAPIQNKILADEEDSDIQYSSQFMGLKSKFAQQMETSIIQKALQEAKQVCSQQNYEIIRTACQSNKAQLYVNLKKNYEKLKKENQEILAANMNNHKQKTNLLWQLNLLKPKVKALEQQKAKIKKQMDQLLDKQAKLFKIEASFAFKQKISLQGRKRYQRQQQSVNNSIRKLQQANKQFVRLWDTIYDKCSASECQNGCWKKDVMKKCKDKIMEQRVMLKAQQQQIQKEYQIMSNLSGQFKRLFSKEELPKQG